MPDIQTVLFDLDGTLLDSVDLIVDSYHHTLAAHSLPPMTDDKATVASWVATYREYNLAHHDSRARAYPGAVEMVHRIKANGQRLGLVTSKNQGGAQRGLALMGLAGVMEVIVGADDVEKPKPDPEPVLLALERMGEPPGTTLFVGDSHHDVFSGRAAGVLTAGVTWGPFDRAHLEYAAPDYYCDTPAELLRLLGI